MRLDPQDDRDELMLDALMGNAHERRRARARLQREPGSTEELRQLAEWLARAGAELRSDVPAGRDARVVARALARTTRQQRHGRASPRRLSTWRERLASSSWRLGAASLLLLLAAGAVLAGRLLLVPEPSPRVALDDADAAGSTTLRVAGLRSAALEFALARERRVLAERAVRAPVVELGPDSAPEARLLAARSRSLRASIVGASPEEEIPEPRKPIELALWTELELDRLVFTGEQADQLGPACLRLQRLAQDPALSARSPGTAALVRAAEQRALTLGLLEGPVPESVPEPLSREWFATLEQAGRESGRGNAAPWKAWLARN